MKNFLNEVRGHSFFLLKFLSIKGGLMEFFCFITFFIFFALGSFSIYMNHVF
jgi:hypothetical protein